MTTKPDTTKVILFHPCVTGECSPVDVYDTCTEIFTADSPVLSFRDANGIRHVTSLRWEIIYSKGR